MTGGLSTWLSDNPGKAWAERYYLAYSPIWIVVVATALLSGAFETWGDPGYMAFGLLLMAPLLVGPALIRNRPDADRPFWRTYWFKLNVWLAIIVCVGNYFISEYFFDVMGMRYGFPTRWNLDSAVMGSGRDDVPAFLYPVTQAYFVTYYVVAVVVLRKIERALTPGPVLRWAAIAAVSYAIAFAETFAMATDVLSGYFEYADRGRMLALGSVGYGLLYFVSLPFAYRIDERPGDDWSLGRVVIEGLAVSMMAIIVFDVWAWIVGPLG